MKSPVPSRRCCSATRSCRTSSPSWAWTGQIDHTRAEAAKKRAEEILARKDLDRREYEMAQARLKRALVRTSIKD